MGIALPLAGADTYYDSDAQTTVFMEELDVGNETVLVATIVKPFNTGFLATTSGIDILAYAASNRSTSISLIGSGVTVESVDDGSSFAQCSNYFVGATVYEDVTVGDKTRRIRFENDAIKRRIAVTVEP